METQNEKIIERMLLIKKCFSKNKLFEIGKKFNISFFDKFDSGWRINEDNAAYHIAFNISDEQLLDIFKKFSPYRWVTFNGKYYTYTGGNLSLSGSWDILQTRIQEAEKKYGDIPKEILNILLSINHGCSIQEIERKLSKRESTEKIIEILQSFEKFNIITSSYSGSGYKEWIIPEEILPLIRSSLEEKIESAGRTQTKLPQQARYQFFKTSIEEEFDVLKEENALVKTMDIEFEEYLADLLKSRLDPTIKFGKTITVTYLSDYLSNLFGKILYFDSLLALIQQYGLADVQISSAQGKTGMRTGFNLSLFGEPGTGKSFASRDMILGRPDAKIPPHGIPGRNRYAGGITPARFIRIGQAYEGRTFNFIIPEFNDWFKYKGMVEPLKLAMERGTMKYETFKEVIGPYKFTSFFSVNYNTAVYGRGYDVTVSDPNFNAIEDRMLCRLHRLTKERFVEIAKSQMRLALGEIDVEEGAKKIRDHLTLVYAIETAHPLVRDRFCSKPVMITHEAYRKIEEARNAILKRIRADSVQFSARLEDRAVRLACAMSLLKYFQSTEDYIPISDDALKFAIRFYVEEASVRSKEGFDYDEVLEEFESK
jgi:hypothetical protein